MYSLQKYAAKKVGHERRRGVRRYERSEGIEGQRFGRGLTTTGVDDTADPPPEDPPTEPPTSEKCADTAKQA